MLLGSKEDDDYEFVDEGESLPGSFSRQYNVMSEPHVDGWGELYDRNQDANGSPAYPHSYLKEKLLYCLVA